MNSDPIEGQGMIEAMAWLEVNKKRLAVAAVVLLVAGFSIYVVRHMARQKEIDASAALIKLRVPMNAPTNQPPISSAEYLKVATTHAGTAAAERAQLLAAGTLFTEGKYAEAQTQFDAFLREHPASAWASEAAYGSAATLESLNKQDEALTAYQRVATTYSAQPVATQARMSIARIYEAKGNAAEALKIYEDLAKPSAGGMSMTSQQALMSRERILKKNPGLARPATNSPAMSASISNAVAQAVRTAAATNATKGGTSAVVRAVRGDAQVGAATNKTAVPTK